MSHSGSQVLGMVGHWHLHHPGTADTHPAVRCHAPDGNGGWLAQHSLLMGLSLSSWNPTADRSPLTKPPQNITDSLYQSCWRMLQKSERSPRQKLLRDSCPSHVLSVMLLSSVWRQDDNSGVLWQIPIGLWSTRVAYLRSCCHVLQGVYSVSAAGSLPSYSPPTSSGVLACCVVTPPT